MATTTTHEEEMTGKTDHFGTWMMERSDEGFWHASAPKRVASLCRPGEGGDGWAAWVHHLRNRRRPTPLEKILAGWEVALLCGLPASFVTTQGLVEIQQWIRGGSEDARNLDAVDSRWQSQTGAEMPTVEDALSALAVVHGLPKMAAALSPDRWWSLLEKIVGLARDAAVLAVDFQQSPTTVLAIQLFAGELPLTLAYVFPEIRPCRQLRKAGAMALSAGLVELCDGEGVMPYRLVDVQRPIAACWARCLAMAHSMKRPCWSEDAQVQFEWHVRQVIRLARANGQMLLSEMEEIPSSPDLVRTMIRLAGDASDVAAAQSLPGKVVCPSDATRSAAPPEPSVHSEWAEFTVLRTDWRRGAPRIAIGCDGPRMALELENRQQTIFHGVWNLDVRVAGRQRQPEDAWEEACWFSDDEVDYLELAIDLAGGGRLERQILLARKDQFLLLADHLMTDHGAGIEYQSLLPIAQDVAFQGETKTRDGCLVGQDLLASVLPLALPEWRCKDQHGDLKTAQGALMLVQETQGSNISCPLFFDLRPQRMIHERTWRQLTIAESLEIQPPDVAVGYRIQCGKRQWVMYRSLAPCGNRTLLGQNISSEFFMGRFLPDGTTEEIIEIELDEEL